MKAQLTRRVSIGLVTCTIIGLTSIGVSGQHKRRRRSRRHPSATTTAAATTASDPSSDAKVVSTDEGSGVNSTSSQSSLTGSRSTSSEVGGGTRSQPAAEADQEHMRRTITKLSSQVGQLTDKLSRMEEQQRTLVDMERLSRAEQRAENLRAQLRDVEGKQGDLQARSEQLDYELQPENIEHSMAAFGATHPEDVREARRRQLQSDKTRVLAQLESLANSRTRLESDVATADADIARLRARIEAVTADQAPTPAAPAKTPDQNVPPSTPNPTSAANPPSSVSPTQTNPPL